MPPRIDPNGPYRRWYNLEPITSYYVFTGSDIVWWTQSNTDFETPPNPPGTGINEPLSDWDYAPSEIISRKSQLPSTRSPTKKVPR